MSAQSMGLVGLGTITPIPGTAAHPQSWQFPTVSLPVQHPRLLELALTADDDLYPEVLAVAEELVRRGTSCILTTCGYFTPYQDGLADALPVPVLTSSLMLLPLLERMVGGTILVLAADGPAVDERCLAASGVRQLERIAVRGLDGPGPFRDQVLSAGVIADPVAITTQAVDAARAAATEIPDLGAICLECGELTLATDAIRAAVAVPVVDYRTAGDLLHRSVRGGGAEVPAPAGTAHSPG